MTRITGHFVLGFTTRVIAVVAQLHATKGWRPPFEAPRRDFPEIGWKGNARRDQIEAPIPMQRLMQRRISPIPITDAALMRHSWYRRQKEKEARAGAIEAWLEAAQ